MTKENKKSEEVILFPEAKVDGVTVVPWSFGKLFDISEELEKVLDEIDNKNLTDMFNTDFIPYTTIARLFTIASDPVLKIMAITLYKNEDNEFDFGESIKKVRKFDMKTGIKIATIIFRQNMEIIKNALSPLLGNLENPEEVGENPKESSEEKETK